MEELKKIFSKNLSALRKKLNLTQVELADKLNYSDKAVSKWERGEAIPDASILKQMASFFNVSIDFLLNEQEDESINKLELNKSENKKSLINNYLTITFLTIFGIWLISLIVFIIIQDKQLENDWWCFIFPIPVCALITFIFACIWAKKVLQCVCLSLFMWTLLLTFYLTFDYNWLIFLIGVPLQVIIFLAYNFRKLKK